MAKFIFVAINPVFDAEYLSKISSFFYSLGVLNEITIGFDSKSFGVYSFNPFAKQELYEASTFEEFFADKLLDMHGFAYETISAQQYPVVFLKNGTISGTNFEFIQTIAKHQNAEVYWEVLVNHQSYSKIVSMLSNRQVDLSLNTVVSFTVEAANVFKTFNTFESDGACIMLPYPDKKTFFTFMMKPFDLWTWIAITVTTAALMIVWHLSNKHSTPNPTSAGLFFFATLQFFLGQSAKLHERRLVQKLISQLMMLMTFVLGNAYQSVLISLMAESRNGDQITTIEEIIDSNFTFQVDKTFLKMFRDSGQYQELANKITSVVPLGKFYFDKLSEAKVGLIYSCSTIDAFFRDTKDLFLTERNAIDYFYKLPMKFYSFYKMLPTAAYSPFVEKFQGYSYKIFESGVRQHWEKMISFEDMTSVRQREANASDDLLNLEDMSGVFYILGIGLAVAFIVFMAELMWHRCMKYRTKRNQVASHRFVHVQPRQC